MVVFGGLKSPVCSLRTLSAFSLEVREPATPGQQNGSAKNTKTEVEMRSQRVPFPDKDPRVGNQQYPRPSQHPAEV